MGYRVHRQDDKFKVVEVSNGEVKEVYTETTEEKAKAISKNLNFGGGFDGYTPNFFLGRLQISEESV